MHVFFHYYLKSMPSSCYLDGSESSSLMMPSYFTVNYVAQNMASAQLEIKIMLN